MGKIFQYKFWEKLMSGCHGKKFSLKILVKIDVRVPRDKKFSRAPGHGFFPKFENDGNDENSSIRSENVMVNPKKFTVWSLLNSGKFGARLFQSLMSTQQRTIPLLSRARFFFPMSFLI